MDPDNPIVRLCMRGMEAEQEGRPDDARALFQQAWDARRNDYEGCIAAHYLARQQADDEATFRWNLRALRLAATAENDGDDAVRGFSPSLHLNMASSYQLLGDRTASLAHLSEAAQRMDVLPDNAYKDMIRNGINNVRGRLDA
jgi:hypothetical protein